MKTPKIFTALCVAAALMTFSACEGTKPPAEDITQTSDARDTEKTDAATDGKTTPPVVPAELFDSEVPEYSVGALGELTDAAAGDTEKVVAALEEEYAGLIAEIDTYEKYLESVGRVWDFYDKVSKTDAALYMRMYEYSLTYAESAVEAGASDEKLDMLYDNMCGMSDKIYGGVYEGILSDMFDDIFAGVLDKADEVAYTGWADVCNAEIDRWDETSTAVFEAYSEFRTDVYDLCADLKRAIRDNDVDTAEKKIQKLRDKVDKMKNGI